MNVASVVGLVIQIYAFTILLYVIMSWIVRSSPSPMVTQAYDFLATVCEPYVGLFRRIIPSTGGVDFSPLVALLVLQWLIEPVLVGLLSRLG